MSYIAGSLLRRLFPKQTENRLDRPQQSVEIVDPLKPVWEVAEGIAGTWHYHVRDVSLPHPLSQPAPCGARVMQTQIPLSAWGTVTDHLHEKWCAVCAKHAGISTGDPSTSEGRNRSKTTSHPY